MSLMDPIWGKAPERIPSPGIFLPRDDDLVELLRASDFDTKISTLNNMVTISKRDPDWFLNFIRKGDLFKALDRILSEDRWEIQHTCCKMLMDVIPTFGTSVEYCMCFLLPKIIPLLGSSKTTVRAVSAQLIQRYLRQQPEGLAALLKITVNYLNAPDYVATKTEVVSELPKIFIPELQQANWTTLIDGLTKWMNNSEPTTTTKILMTLKRLHIYLSQEAFRKVLSTLPIDQQNNYLELEHTIEIEDNEELNLKKRMSGRHTAGERRFRFGFIPMHISAMLSDDEVKNRQQAIDEIKRLIDNITPDEISRLVPHMHSFLMTLGNVLADLNFRIVVTGLDVLRLTINRLKGNVEAHLQQVVSLLSKHLGNQKAIIKQILMMCFMDLFQNLNPKMVIGTLAVSLENRNSRIREEVVNILTSALMIISPSRINFSAVINMLVPLLIDPKRRVRLAAFEQLSVVAYLLNGKLEQLVKAVREVEAKHGCQGLMAAVQARIKRNLLPRIRFDGLIEYSTPPASDSSFDVEDEEMSAVENADLRWILHANGSDSLDRPVSPLHRPSEPGISPQVKVNSLPWNTDKIKPAFVQEPLLLQERMMSDDMIIRKPSDVHMGAVVARSQSATVRTSKVGRISTCSLPGAIPQPGSSTASWHAPTRRQDSIPYDDTRSASAFIRRGDSAECKVDPYLTTTTRNNGFKRGVEMNNNDIITNKMKLLQMGNSMGLSKAKSEGNLLLDEDRSAANHDEVPIKPSKNGMYTVDDGEISSYSAPVKKSISHYSLPITTKKRQPFLKSGSAKHPRVAPTKSHPVKSNSTPAPSAGSRPQGTSVSSALQLMSSDEWTDKVSGLEMITELSNSNPTAVGSHMHEVVAAVVAECKNLRSSVSRVALTTLGTLFQNMKAKMDGEIEKSAAILMQKAGDVSSAFIRDDATDSLQKMIKYGSPSKTLTYLLASGSKSKNNTIRASCASFVCTLCQRLGPTNVLNSSEITKLIPQLIAFAKDHTPHVRQAGRQALVDLSQDPSFDRMMKKNVSEHDYKQVREILGHIEKKGGMDALDATNMSLGSSLSRSGSVRKALSRKLPDGVQLDLDECRNQMTAAGWEKRVAALERFEKMCANTPKVVASDTKLIEAFIARLSDINNKVALQAMDTYLLTLPFMSRCYSTETNMKAILNQLCLALMSHLSSKSEQHKHLAQTCLEQTVAHIDGAALSQAMAAATKKANVKQKPFMLDVFTKMNTDLYPHRPKQVEINALPALYESLQLGLGDAELKRAVGAFARNLAHLMGQKALLHNAEAELEPPKRKLLESLL